MEAVELAEFIRESSRAGILLSSADLEAEIAERELPVSDRAKELVQAPVVSALIQEAALGMDDIQIIQDDSGGPWYYSQRFMTASYARVLLLKGRGALEMMAEVIREHSRVYPRPVPIALFRCAPFSLSEDEIELHLKEMAGKSSYRDIARLVTSIGNAFAYSTDHLEPGYAAMLAEWADAGQVQNP